MIPQHIGPIDLIPLVPYIAIASILGFILTIVPGLIWIERVVIALMQDRLGPNRVGPRGLLQTIADGIKLFFKEDIEPKAVDKKIYYLAPVLAMIPALAAGATIPFASITFKMDDGTIRTLPVVAGNVNVGVLYVLAMASLQVYGVILAGWASNNKYSLLGGLRSSAQIISYELAMSLSIMCGVFISGSLNLAKVVESQAGPIWHWNVFQFYGLGFLATCVYVISMIAETNRAPFDLPEAESELIAGFHTEYSSMKFAMFFMGEYASMLAVSGIATTLWFGGWHSPFGSIDHFVPGAVWFLAKIGAIFLVYVWLRASLPRLRYDALMSLGWKRLLPFALAILFGIAVVDTLQTPVEKTPANVENASGRTSDPMSAI
ncbi:MAG: NADH-quinone oxidoreductase subunit NuoH [Chthonomonadales bacterium]